MGLGTLALNRLPKGASVGSDVVGLDVVGLEVVGVIVVGGDVGVDVGGSVGVDEGEALRLAEGKDVGLVDGMAETVGEALGHIKGVGRTESVGFWVGLVVGRRLSKMIPQRYSKSHNHKML